MKWPWRNILFGCLILAGIAALLLWILFHNYEPRYNQPLEGAGTQPPAHPVDDPAARGMWPDQPEQDDNALVLLAISGGGTRAAAVGWKTLETLREVKYRFTNAAGKMVESNLANEIDLIAGISGGSFTATAWCLGNDAMARFRKEFVERDIQWALALDLAKGKGIIALFSTPYARINVAAELYDREVFDRKTFTALPVRPILRLHATNLALGQRFTFTHETFAALSSDLNAYPLGYACAASSAFPILLDPLTVRNYPPPLNLATDITYVMDQRNAREDLNKALRVTTRDYYNDKDNQYIHLADGGLVDNQGLQSILDEFETNGLINKRVNYKDSPLRRLIIVNVNAGVAKTNKSGRSAAPPDLASVVGTTMVASMDVLSARRWMDIKTRCQQLFSAKIDVGGTERSYAELQEPYRIEINFRNITDAATQRKAMELPTSFKLTPDQIGLIDKVVPQLLEEDPDLIRLKAELAK